MNLLDLVPTLKRQLRQYIREEDTDSKLAAYLADGIEAMAWRWVRDYAITYTAPETYNVSPDVVVKDKRPIILMASIIYKASSVQMASFRDGDFAYDPVQGRTNPIQMDLDELDKLVAPSTARLASAISAPMYGYSHALNPENYDYLVGLGILY